MKDETRVSIAAAVCTFGLAVVFKELLRQALNLVEMFIPIMLFMVYTWTKDIKPIRHTANIWIGLIVAVTIAIIVLYALS